MTYYSPQAYYSPQDSTKLNFDNLNSINESKQPRLFGNLKDYHETSFIIPDIYLNEKSIVLDVGANVGSFTSIFARYNCKVYSFEPTKVTFNILLNRFKNIKNVILKM